MAGLRNSGVDTSAWYLPGVAGTELVRAFANARYDPNALFGGNLPDFDLLKVYDFAQAALPGGTFSKAVVGLGMTDYIQNDEGLLVSRGRDVPSYVRNPTNPAQVLGLRISGTRGCQATGSGNFTHADYTKANITATSVTPSGFGSVFDGVSTVTKLTGGAGAVERRARYSGVFNTFIDSARFTLSIHLRKDTAGSGTNECWVGMVSSPAPTVNFSGVLVDLNARTAVASNGGVGAILDIVLTERVDDWLEVSIIGSLTDGVDQLPQIVMTSGGAFTHSVAGQTLYTAALTAEEFAYGVANGSATYGAVISGSNNGHISPENWLDTALAIPGSAPVAVVFDFDLLHTTGHQNNTATLMHVGANTTGSINALGLYGTAEDGKFQVQIITNNVTRLALDFLAVKGRHRFVLRSAADGYDVHHNGVKIASAAFVAHPDDTLDTAAVGAALAPTLAIRKITVTGALTEGQALSLSTLP